MEELSYDGFRELLPTAGKVASYARGPLGVASPEADFCKPNIVPTTRLQGSETVMLVSAPAAVGKSVLAKQLSHDLKGLYWNLSDFSLGSNFFVGTAVKHYGPTGYSQLVDELQRGQRILILDAADEALVRAGRENFIAAIENLSEITQGCKGPAVILLGREDTIADTAMELLRNDVHVGRFSVAYFSKAQARAFIKSKAKKKNPAVREFDEFVTSFFASVQTALGAESWDEGRDFLGYAPVLDVVAKFYTRETNPIRVLQAVRKSASDRHVWNLLAEIFEKILVREQEKFANNFGGVGTPKGEFGAAAFTPRAQIAYLLDESTAPQAFEFDGEGDEQWFTDLEEQIERQLSEHPFLRANQQAQETNPLLRFANGAFRDYAVAVGLTDSALCPPALLFSYWRAPQLNPTPILSGLLFALARDDEKLFPSQTFGMVHDSHASSKTESDPAFILTTTADTVGRDSLHLAMQRWTGSGDSSPSLLIDVSQDAPAFARMAARSLSDLYGLDVRLGDGFADFLLGPEAVIIAKSLSSLVPEIRVRSNIQGSRNVLSMGTVGGFTRRIHAVPASSLNILQQSGSLPYPWQPHVVAPGLAGLDNYVSLSDAMEIRRLVMWFSKPSMFGGGLRYPVAATEALVGKGRLSDLLIDFLTTGGFLEKNRDEYVLSIPVQSYIIVSNDTEDLDYRQFLSTYTAWKKELISEEL